MIEPSDWLGGKRGGEKEASRPILMEVESAEQAEEVGARIGAFLQPVGVDSKASLIHGIGPVRTQEGEMLPVCVDLKVRLTHGITLDRMQEGEMLADIAQ